MEFIISVFYKFTEALVKAIVVACFNCVRSLTKLSGVLLFIALIVILAIATTQGWKSTLIMLIIIFGIYAVQTRKF